MKHTKCLITIIMLVLYIGKSFAYGQNTLVVEMYDGSAANFLLVDKPRITFVGKLVRIVSDSCSMEFMRSDIKKCSFSDEVSVGISEILSESQAKIENDVIVVCGVVGNMPISVYTTNGMLVKQFIVVDGNAEISLSDLEGGLYIVTFNNTTFKILK